MGLCLVAVRKLSFWSVQLGKMLAPFKEARTASKLFGSVPSLLQARPSIDTVSWFYLAQRRNERKQETSHA